MPALRPPINDENTSIMRNRYFFYYRNIFLVLSLVLKLKLLKYMLYKLTL